MLIFHGLWITVSSAVMLPLGAALMAGRVPPWMRRDSTPGVLKVKGSAAFVLYVGLLVPPVTALSGIGADATELVRMVLVPTCVVAGYVLIVGTTLCDRFNRRRAANWSTVMNGDRVGGA